MEVLAVTNDEFNASKELAPVVIGLAIALLTVLLAHPRLNPRSAKRRLFAIVIPMVLIVVGAYFGTGIENTKYGTTVTWILTCLLAGAFAIIAVDGASEVRERDEELKKTLNEIRTNTMPTTSTATGANSGTGIIAWILKRLSR